jgi:anti-sigma factor ChrR (cupin superfamily)
MRLTTVALASLFLAASGFAQTKELAKKAAASPMATVVAPGSEKWGDLPAAALVGTPSVDMGGKVQLAVVQGNPMQAGAPYTVRLSCTDGTKIAPHWHPATENVTVVKGTFEIGMGSKWDSSALKELPVGGFASAPARMRHFAMCKGDSIVQVHGLGPLVINFVEADKPKSGN